MAFDYTKQNLTNEQKRLQRLFEIVPGAISWGILLGIAALALFRPVAASVFAIAFIFYWFLRLVYMTMFLVISFMKLRAHAKTDWRQKLSELDSGGHASHAPAADEIVHLVILPVAIEPEGIIRPAIEALADQTFSASRIMVVFGVEEHAPATTQQAVKLLVKEYQDTFFDFLSILHPAGLAGEARVKGANASCAAEHAAKRLASRGIRFERVVVSCFDADTVVDRQYFACLTYHYLVTPGFDRASYQPIPVYNNNIWSVPGFSRVMEIGSSFFQLIEATNPEKLVTFSSHSMSFPALVEMNFWPRDMISDDSAVFWKAYIHYDGRYKVVPLPITVSMDATVAETRWRTLKNIYKQRRRWAYGVENFPLLMRGFLHSPGIPLSNKTRHIFKMLEGHVSWATWGFLLTTLGWLPALLAGRAFQSSVIYYNEPHIAATIFRLSSFSLIISIALSIALLPKARIKFGRLKKIRHVFEWLFMPLAIVFLGALPALDAQTRLMLGKYLEFWVTDKSRKPLRE